MSEKAVDIAVRPTVRVLLLDRDGRILLMKGRLPGMPGQGAWFTVGGKVEEGESYLEAATREIAEETGILDAELGPVVWLREGVLGIPHPTRFVEQYVVARCDAAEPSRHGWQPDERELIDDIRWWTLQELTVTPDAVFPPGLAQLLPDVLAGRFPPAPHAIPWA